MQPFQDNLSDEHRQLENALRPLRPATTALNRDALLYEAGRRAGRRQGQRWAALPSLLCAAMAAAMVLQSVAREPAPVPLARETTLSQPAVVAQMPTGSDGNLGPHATVAAPAAPPPEYALIRMTGLVLTEGLDALPETPRSSSEEPKSFADVLRRSN